jgi:hypothetical protein
VSYCTCTVLNVLRTPQRFNNITLSNSGLVSWSPSSFSPPHLLPLLFPSSKSGYPVVSRLPSPLPHALPLSSPSPSLILGGSSSFSLFLCLFNPLPCPACPAPYPYTTSPLPPRPVSCQSFHLQPSNSSIDLETAYPWSSLSIYNLTLVCGLSVLGAAQTFFNLRRASPFCSGTSRPQPNQPNDSLVAFPSLQSESRKLWSHFTPSFIRPSTLLHRSISSTTHHHLLHLHLHLPALCTPSRLTPSSHILIVRSIHI